MVWYPLVGEGQDVAQDMVTVQEAARRLGVKEDAVRKRIQRGRPRRYRPPAGALGPRRRPNALISSSSSSRLSNTRTSSLNTTPSMLADPMPGNRPSGPRKLSSGIANRKPEGSDGAASLQREGAYVVDRGRDQREGLAQAPRFPVEGLAPNP